MHSFVFKWNKNPWNSYRSTNSVDHSTFSKNNLFTSINIGSNNGKWNLQFWELHITKIFSEEFWYFSSFEESILEIQINQWHKTHFVYDILHLFCTISCSIEGTNKSTNTRSRYFNWCYSDFFKLLNNPDMCKSSSSTTTKNERKYFFIHI